MTDATDGSRAKSRLASDEFDLVLDQVAKRKATIQGDADITPDELRKVIELSRDLLAIATFDGYFEALSASWETLLGFSRDELRSKPFIEFVHPDDRDKTEVTAERLQPGIELLSFQNRYVARDGTAYPINWRAIVDPKTERYYCAAQSMKPVLASREDRAALESLTELVDGAVIFQDTSGKITRCGGQAEAFFGQSGRSIVGHSVASHVRFVDAGDATDFITVIETCDNEDAVPIEVRRADGTWHPARASIREFGDGASIVTGAVARIVAT